MPRYPRKFLPIVKSPGLADEDKATALIHLILLVELITQPMMLIRISSGMLAQPCAKSLPSFSVGESSIGTGAAISVGFGAETKMYAPPDTSILMSNLHVTRHLVPGAIVMCVVRLIMLGPISASDSVISLAGRDSVASVDEAMLTEKVSREVELGSSWG